MAEIIAAVAGLAAVSWFLSARSLWKKRLIADNQFSQPIEHTVTLWKVGGERDPDSPPTCNELRPKRITVEYSVMLDAESAEMLSALQNENVEKAAADFHGRFASFLDDDAGMGAVRIEAEDDQGDEDEH